MLAVLVLGVGLADDGFQVTAPLGRGGPQLTVRVTPRPATSNWLYDVHITADGLDQHLAIRNGRAVTREDVRLADINADGYLDVMVVGGKDHRGEAWFKTWVYDPTGKKYVWVASVPGK